MITTPPSGEPNPQGSLDRLVELIQVAPTGDDTFRGHSEDIGTPAVFGGQVLGQALMAACLAAPEGRGVHSLHAYFLLPGEHAPIDYEVERVRDGSSFSMRRVVARQQQETIFEMLASFQLRELGLERHDPMPPIPGPDGVRSEVEHRRAILDRLPPSLRDKVMVPSGIEYRPVVPFDLFDAAPREARASIWLRASGRLPDAPALHQALLAYASDHGLLITGTLPHGLSVLKGQVRLASIDHAMWFHRDFRIDDWLLYHVESSTASGGRALCRGTVYAQDGRLVATTMQEGLMRLRRRAPRAPDAA
ncbi:MAG TPA: acyl-CoA thioesterase II [Burkholderiaceae bacterium]|nr:acyl-CoA thioesterase II [Burkholderiaceae bacterium]